MSCSKHGSRSMDAIWDRASPGAKELIAFELSNHESMLNNDHFGKFIASKVSISTYKRAKSQWKEMLNKDKKKRDLFSEILGNDAPKPKKAKIEETPVTNEEKKVKHKDSLDTNEVIEKKVKLEEASLTNEVSEKKAKKKKKKNKEAPSYLDDL